MEAIDLDLNCFCCVILYPYQFGCNCIGCCSVGYLLAVFATVAVRFNDYVSMSIGCNEKQMVNLEYPLYLQQSRSNYVASQQQRTILSKNGFQSKQAQKWTDSRQTIKHNFNRTICRKIWSSPFHCKLTQLSQVISTLRKFTLALISLKCHKFVLW